LLGISVFYCTHRHKCSTTSICDGQH